MAVLSPEGWQKVAGGRSVAETTGRKDKPSSTRNGCQKLRLLETCYEGLWHPFWVRTHWSLFPVVCAALRPPATICQPFRLIEQTNSLLYMKPLFSNKAAAGIQPEKITLVTDLHEDVRPGCLADEAASLKEWKLMRHERSKTTAARYRNY
jgi:hypothetical protein